MKKKITLSIALISVSSVYSFSQEQVNSVTLAFTGDIMMGTNYPSEDYLMPDDGVKLFQDATPVIQAADCAFGNLEGTLLDEGGTVKKCKDPNVCYAFRTPVRYVANLVNAGFDAMSVANNHANDFGLEGRESTMNTLQNARIAYAGQMGYCETALFRKGGITYGFCAFGHSVNTPNLNNLEQTEKIIKSLRPQCDILVVSFHGGAEGINCGRVPKAEEEFMGEDRGDVMAFAHRCIDSGADAVFGHGPHLPRAMELYNGHVIAYSLGNFCTPYRMSLKGALGYAPIITVKLNKNDGTFLSGKITSFIQTRGVGPRTDGKHGAAQYIKYLTKLDFPETGLVIDSKGYISRKR